MATLRGDTPLSQLFDSLTRLFTLQGKRVRDLDIVGKDRDLPMALADPIHVIGGIANRLLQKTLHNSPWAKGHTSKALSARISRHRRLLRDHGLLRKTPNQRKYMLTETGRSLATALPALLAASIQQLTEKAA